MSPLRFFILAALAIGVRAADPPKSPPPKKPVPAPASAPATPKPTQAAPAEGPTPEDLIMIRATPYRAVMERDPFRSPTDVEGTTPRSDMIEDISVKGIIISGGKRLAIVSDSRGNIRSLPVGYRFKDGTIAAIDDKSVTFHQYDPYAPTSKYKTVVKTFKREEGKR